MVIRSALGECPQGVQGTYSLLQDIHSAFEGIPVECLEGARSMFWASVACTRIVLREVFKGACSVFWVLEACLAAPRAVCGA